MFLNSNTKSHFASPLGGLKIIAAVGVSSIFLSNCVIASDIHSVNKIPTASTINYAPTRQIPAGYVKGNYKVVAYAVKGEKLCSPAANELSLQEAAEITAQELFRLYNVKLTDQTINMYYWPKDKNKPSSWSVDLAVTPDYAFMVHLDAASGEITFIDCQGHPSDKKQTASEDDKTLGNSIAAAEKGLADPNAACNTVKTLLTQKGFITEPIESIKYTSSSYGTHCNIAHPYSTITHLFTITTTSKKSYDISTSTDLTVITNFFKYNQY